MTTTTSIDTMTTRQLIKLHGDISATIARRHEQELGQAQSTETKLREELRSLGQDLDVLARKWDGKLAQAFTPKAVAASSSVATNGNGHKQPKPRRVRATQVATKTKLAPKYKDADGHAWSGRGKRPRWLTARIDGGAKIEEFRV